MSAVVAREQKVCYFSPLALLTCHSIELQLGGAVLQQSGEKRRVIPAELRSVHRHSPTLGPRSHLAKGSVASVWIAPLGPLPIPSKQCDALSLVHPSSTCCILTGALNALPPPPPLFVLLKKRERVAWACKQALTLELRAPTPPHCTPLSSLLPRLFSPFFHLQTM